MPGPVPVAAEPQAKPGNVMHPARGLIREIAPDLKTAVIRHEAIPGYMPKMTMELTVLDPEELKNLKEGDEITFEMHADDERHWIKNLKRIGTSGGGNSMVPPSKAAALKPRVDKSLKIGEEMPDFAFTSEHNEEIRFSRYHGSVVAFTFIFTRCPLPDFCPRMGRQFANARQSLLENSGGMTNYQFLSISFDPEFDRPSVLTRYANSYRQGNAEHWLFAVASTEVLQQLAPLCDLHLTKENGSISHNLRTVVLDPQGKVVCQFDGNSWTGEHLAEAMRQAAKPPSGQ
jgi:protein SCO1